MSEDPVQMSPAPLPSDTAAPSMRFVILAGLLFIFVIGSYAVFALGRQSFAQEWTREVKVMIKEMKYVRLEREAERRFYFLHQDMDALSEDSDWQQDADRLEELKRLRHQTAELKGMVEKLRAERP